MEKEFIRYEDFGAVGDGAANDMPAIIKAHEEANRLGRPVRASEGAKYYIAPIAAKAVIKTDTDWTGAEFIIDDVGLDDIHTPVFEIPYDDENIELDIRSLSYGQTRIENPTGRKLFVIVVNEKHMDYIRWGANQSNGHPRTDILLVMPDGSLSTPVSFDFDEITSVTAKALPDDVLTIRGGKFTTIANQCESKYNYHARNIAVRRSHTRVENISHYVTGELDHGAPYSGFISFSGCAEVTVENCLFTGHKIYWTIGAAGTPVPMGSYDIGGGTSARVAFRHCRQTTDIMDRNYWGIIGTNFCRELSFEDCVFSRFDAHMGVSYCEIRGCRLGWQCLNAIGFGRFVIEDTEAYGGAFVNLRDDYGCTWRGDFEIRNCVWYPAGSSRSIFRANNPGGHDFGYTCYLPENILIDGLKIVPQENAEVGKVFVINNWQPEDSAFPMIPPKAVYVKNIIGADSGEFCENERRNAGTDMTVAT